mmetsp:Transcript_27974/g.55076  ORF Transcript_27974/g.55076 Transcript_27974/m.55076 type:complete len:81 (-) Transcript_27974:1306-1548(-)
MCRDNSAGLQIMVGDGAAMTHVTIITLMVSENIKKYIFFHFNELKRSICQESLDHVQGKGWIAKTRLWNHVTTGFDGSIC